MFCNVLNDYYSIWTKNSVLYDRDVKQSIRGFASKARFYCFQSLSADESVIWNKQIRTSFKSNTDWGVQILGNHWTAQILIFISILRQCYPNWCDFRNKIPIILWLMRTLSLNAIFKFFADYSQLRSLIVSRDFPIESKCRINWLLFRAV